MFCRIAPASKTRQESPVEPLEVELPELNRPLKVRASRPMAPVSLS
jgi:hypothetical protein